VSSSSSSSSASCGSPEQDLSAPVPAGETVIQGSVHRDGAPIDGAYVRLLDGAGEFTAEVVTGAGGGFRFFARPGSWTVRALAPGASAEAPVAVDLGAVVEVALAVG